mmetsp:Transcript_37678/g.117875  ORF Transcript_37678/g.117875 Transcript_37678/m.117875 type:complete len:211 (+) Transcript_37678:3837-4469(+)
MPPPTPGVASWTFKSHLFRGVAEAGPVVPLVVGRVIALHEGHALAAAWHLRGNLHGYPREWRASLRTSREECRRKRCEGLSKGAASKLSALCGPTVARQLLSPPSVRRWWVETGWGGGAEPRTSVRTRSHAPFSWMYPLRPNGGSWSSPLRPLRPCDGLRCVARKFFDGRAQVVHRLSARRRELHAFPRVKGTEPAREFTHVPRRFRCGR